MATQDFISVICSTYNRPDALDAALSGLIRQTDNHFEVIIADDGSTDDTRKVVAQYQRTAPFRVSHAWHEDQGFRLAAIRNLALQYAKGSYILFLDGDCIPSPEWIRHHRALAEKGWTVSGQRILTSQAFCSELLNDKDFQSNFDWKLSSFRRLARNKQINRWTPAISFCINNLSFWRKCAPKNWKMIRGCNWGIWHEDLTRVGAFNEKMVGWGHEDSELAIRLMNEGVKFKSGSFATAVLHLWHQEASREHSKENWRLALSNISR